MESNPHNSLPSEKENPGRFKITVMELAVVCWIVTVLISMDEQIPPKLDLIEIIAIGISAMVTLVAIVAPLILHYMQRTKESGAQGTKPSNTQQR